MGYDDDDVGSKLLRDAAGKACSAVCSKNVLIAVFCCTVI
jgi:hypothetical protein